MPIHTQCCGLFLMGLLLFFYKSQKTIKLQGERAFWSAFVMTFVCIGCDILSCVAIVNRGSLPGALVNFICKSYIVTIIGEAFFALMYIFTDIYTKRRDYKKASIRFGVFVAVGVLAVYILPINIFHDPTGGTLYTYGPACYAAYGFAAATFFVIIFRMQKDKAKINHSKRSAVYMWLSIWALALVIQFFFKEILLTAFACSVGMLVLYLKLENPGNNLDRQTGLFNHSAFLEYGRELYDSDVRFSVLSIILDRTAFKTMCSDLEEHIINEAVDYLSSLTDVYVFRNTTNEILLVWRNKEKSGDGVARVRERFSRGWGKNGGVIVSPHWIYVYDSSVASGINDLLYLMSYVRREGKELQESQFYEVTNELAEKLHNEKDIEELIAYALANDKVEVWYQPIFSTESHKFTSAEALVRIRGYDGKLIPPGAFIEIAERNGTIMQIGELVFKKVCSFIKSSGITNYGINYIEVNLSVVQCAYKHLAREYIDIMDEYKIPAGCINLEITESASMNSKQTLLNNMHILMDYGVTFSLDDFGTGQSNLDYIVDMPVHIVKFDKNMTNAYFENGKAKYIMDAAMNMIRGMDLKIVSEGIETSEQFSQMENLGINFIQGYYFSKPLPEAEFLEFIKRENLKMSG